MGWHEDVDDPLVRDLCAYVRQYVVATDEEVLVIALWVLHTYVYDQYPQTPYLAVTSAEKGSAKTRVLEVIEQVVRKPWRTIVPSEAVLYRHIHDIQPTLMLDETDTIFNPRMQDRYEGHRAILNSGNRQGSTVPRCVGSSNKIQEFRVFCPKALAGIGTLPDTVTDRAIPVRMKRKRKDERVDRFLLRTVGPQAEALRERIEAWLVDLELEETPSVPEVISDRMQEGCEPLVAIADERGCGDEARAALVVLLTTERLDSVELMRHRLLRDIRTVWLAAEAELGRQGRSMGTGKLLAKLHALPDGKWDNYYGRPLNSGDLADLLRPYNVKPHVLSGGKKRGYRRDDLHDLWERYLPPVEAAS